MLQIEIHYLLLKQLYPSSESLQKLICYESYHKYYPVIPPLIKSKIRKTFTNVQYKLMLYMEPVDCRNASSVHQQL
jgi:hypothetical protein